MTTPTPRTPLGRRFTILWAGQSASILGTNVSAAGMSIAAFVETGSVWWLSTIYLAIRMPGLLVASHAGDLVDRTDRRRVLLAADSVAAAATLVAITLLLLGRLELWHLVVTALVGATAGAYQEPAYTSSLPLLVPRAAVDRANGMLQFGPAIAILAGPALAGGLVAIGGIGAVLAFDVATFLLALAATAAIDVPHPVDTQPDAQPPTARRGLRATWDSLDGRLRGLRHLLVYASVLNLVISAVNVLLFALLVPLAGEAGAGLLLSLGGLAMLAGALAVSSRGLPPRRVQTVVLAVVAIGVGIVLTGIRPTPALVALGLMATLGAAAVLSAAAGTLFQSEVPLHRQGRIASLRRVAAEGLVPFAVVGIAPLVDALRPLLADGGRLAPTVGTVLGTGPGREVALVFVLVGLAVITIGAVIARDRTLAVLDRAPDDEEPPAVPLVGAAG